MRKPKLPPVASLSKLIRDLKPHIVTLYDEEEIPSLDLTIGCDPNTGDWAFQTGDNSYSGPAYFYQYWGVTTIYRRSSSVELARDLREQIADLWYQ